MNVHGLFDGLLNGKHIDRIIMRDNNFDKLIPPWLVQLS